MGKRLWGFILRVRLSCLTDMSVFWGEKETIAAMIRLFCGERHGSRNLCPECGGLLDYAVARLDHCPFGEDKPVCARCLVHCYKPGMRERVKDVMRFAGPRMAWRHPWLALVHAVRSHRKRRPRSRGSAIS